ncbi:MAG: hypothetical protein AABW88_01010 [Nanoarchaeota archaeon]
MIKAGIEYINSKLAVLNYFEKSFGLCEIISKGDKTFPAEYLHNGEYKQINNFDTYNGVSYLRKNGDISISDVENTLEACGILSSINIPMKLVLIIPRKKLDCDDNYSEDVIAQTIMRELLTKDVALKQTLNARQAKIQIDSYSTNSISILNEEYSKYPKKDINYKYAYLSLNIIITAIVTQDCLTRDCYGQYS